MDTLHRRGLVNFYIKRRFKYWTAANPERLLITLHEREVALRFVLPSLNALLLTSDGRPIVKVFNGSEEIKLIMEDILATQRHILAIISWSEWVRLFGDEYVNDFIDGRARHFLKIRLLAPKENSTLKLTETDPKFLRESRFMSEHTHIKITIFIYGNKVAIISLNKKQPTGVLIEDLDIRDTMVVFFEGLWKLSSL